MGKVLKLVWWVAHALSQVDRNCHWDICMSLLLRLHNFEWLGYIITCGEKWCLYINCMCHGQWVSTHQQQEPEPKPDLHARKLMLLIWWDVRSIIFWEVLPHNQTVIAEYYCNQLQHLDNQLALDHLRHCCVLFFHHNVCLHAIKCTRDQLL